MWPGNDREYTRRDPRVGRAATDREGSLLPWSSRPVHTSAAPHESVGDRTTTGHGRGGGGRPPPCQFLDHEDRPPLPGGDSMIREQISPAGRETGSRPITHGCSARDPRPGSPGGRPFARSRRPFDGPWPTPRVPRFAASGLRIRYGRARRPGNGRVVPVRGRRRSMASAHHSGTNVPGYSLISTGRPTGARPRGTAGTRQHGLRPRFGAVARCPGPGPGS